MLKKRIDKMVAQLRKLCSECKLTCYLPKAKVDVFYDQSTSHLHPW